MSIKVMSLVWDAPLARPQKYVLLALADHAHDDGTQIYPSVATIVKKTDYAERQVQRIIEIMVEVGLLVPDGPSRYGTNEYHINLSMLDRSDLLKGGDIYAKHAVTFTAKKAALMSPEPSSEPSLGDPSLSTTSASALAVSPSVPPLRSDPERGYDPKREYQEVRQAEEDMIAELRASLQPNAAEKTQQEKEAETDAAAWMGYPTTPGFIGGPGITDKKRRELVAGLRAGAAEEAARHVKPETWDLDKLRGYGFVDPLGQHLTTDVPPGTDDEEDIPEPAPGILEVQISDEAFQCPNCFEDVHLSAINKRSCGCPNCGTHLRVVWENDQGDLKTVREPRKGAMGASYALEIDGQTYTCQSKREQIQAKSLIRTEPALFRKRLAWFEENAGYRKKFKREEVIGKTIRAVQNDINKRIPTQGDLEEDEHHALRF